MDGAWACFTAVATDLGLAHGRWCTTIEQYLSRRTQTYLHAELCLLVGYSPPPLTSSRSPLCLLSLYSSHFLCYYLHFPPHAPAVPTSAFPLILLLYHLPLSSSCFRYTKFHLPPHVSVRNPLTLSFSCFRCSYFRSPPYTSAVPTSAFLLMLPLYRPPLSSLRSLRYHRHSFSAALSVHSLSSSSVPTHRSLGYADASQRLNRRLSAAL